MLTGSSNNRLDEGDKTEMLLVQPDSVLKGGISLMLDGALLKGHVHSLGVLRNPLLLLDTHIEAVARTS